MNTDSQKLIIIIIIIKQIQSTEKHLLKLKLLRYENEFCNVIEATNILIREEQQFFIRKLKKLTEIYYEFQLMRSNESIKITY